MPYYWSFPCLTTKVEVLIWSSQVGVSTTTGSDNCVTWNDIHHKTSNRHGHPYGYPDPAYLDNVLAELAQHGVVDQ